MWTGEFRAYMLPGHTKEEYPMTAVIAYQSLNSNSASEHGLAASTSQAHLRQAQRTLAALYPEKSGALKYPTNTDIEPHVALQGPAQLVPVADAAFMDVNKPSKKRKRDAADDETDKGFQEAKSRTLSMVEGKALQIYQQAYRDVHAQCDLIVFGELDSTHPDWGSITATAGKRVKSSIRTKACNCFSLHSSGSDSHVKFIAEGEGWCAARCRGVLVVFVHVPNSLAAKRDLAITFYKGVKNAVLTASNGGIIDVIMGDTNQPTDNFSPEVISKGLDQTFKDAHNSSQISPTDTWAPKGVTHQGTNSVNTKKFDVAVYNTATVAQIDVTYFTQFSFASNKAAAYTDHMGILVKVTKK
jgi:hypothetical protein